MFMVPDSYFGEVPKTIELYSFYKPAKLNWKKSPIWISICMVLIWNGSVLKNHSDCDSVRGCEMVWSRSRLDLGI